MLRLKFINYLYILFLIINIVKSEEKYGIINSKRAINIVDEKFLSISVDPAILLSGVKISPITQHLVTLLSPAYFRLAGPSTSYLDFDSDDSHATTRITAATDRLVVTPGSLATVNRYLVAANVTPVLGLNDWTRTTSEKWNTQYVTEMLKWMEKDGNIGDCYWQLGYDNTNKTLDLYKEDITSLKNILDTFPKQSEHWKILGSDFTTCQGDEKFNIGAIRNKLIGVDGIIWEKNNKEFEDYAAEQSIKYMMYETPIWTVAPKTNTPISFESAILWANQIGEAANDGFKVIFRQPRIHEFFTDTPPFWVSYFHKKFMGRNVLDVRMLEDNKKNVSVYAHCTKRQNNFPKAGAISVLIINNSTEKEVVNLKINGVLSNNKLSYEVQSFILEASDDDQSNILLNDNKISINEIENNKSFLPKLRRARLNKNLILIIPPKSIAFYLLPGARLPVCVSDEDEDDLILKEIIADQQIKFSQEQDDKQLKPRYYERKANLNDLYQMAEKELETSENYYKKDGFDEIQRLADKIKEIKHKKALEDDGELILDIPKILEVKTVEERVQDLKDKIKEKLETRKVKNNLDLTNNEMVKVLKERAVSKIEKSKSLTENDIEGFIHKALNLKPRQKRDLKHGRNRTPSKSYSRAHHGFPNYKNRNTLNARHPGQINNNPLNQNRNIIRRPRRDINLDVLKTKSYPTGNSNKFDKTLSKCGKALFENNGEIEATIRQAGQTSLELLADSLEDVEDDEEEKIPSEVFAELARPENLDKSDEISNFFIKKDEVNKPSFTWDDSMLKPKPKVDFSGLFQLPKLKPLITNKSTYEMKPRSVAMNDESQDKHVDEIDSFESLEDGLINYHGFFEDLGDAIAIEKRKNIDGRNEYFEYAKEIDEEANNLTEKLNNLNTLLKNKKNNNDDDFDMDYSFRRKREAKEYTEDDITFYKKLMQSNIKHMREQMARSRLRNGLDNFNNGFPKIFQARSGNIGNTNKGIKNRNNESKKDKLDDMKIESQKRMLKTRLNNKRKHEEKRKQSKSLDSVLSKIKANPKGGNKDLINTSNSHRRRRAITEEVSQNFDEVYKPIVQLESISKAYEPVLQLVMEDFLPEIEQSKKVTIEMTNHLDDKQKPQPIPIFTKEIIEKSLPKTKGYVAREDEFDVLQDINHVFNIIQKDSEFVRPFWDEVSGEYDIVFPTKDEIKLVKNRGFTELEFVHKTTTEKASTENPFDKLTCTANYQDKKDTSTELSKTIYLEKESINLNLVDYDELTSTEYINVYIGNEKHKEFDTPENSAEGVSNSLNETDEHNIELTTGVTQRNNIQQIQTDKDKSASKVDMIQKVFGQFKKLVDAVGSIVHKYVHIFHEGKLTTSQNETAI